MILIVDDKKENIIPLESLLSLHSYPVDTAMSGEEALRKILKNNYALIILDVQMPGMDGFEVAQTISGHSKVKDVPIIFLSAVNTDKRFITKGYSSGAIDYITKPIDPDILLLKVNTLYKLYEQKRKLNEMHVKLESEIEFRKQAQFEINEKAKELRSILESIPQIAFTTTKQGELEYYNSQWLKYADIDNRLNTHPDDPYIIDELKKMAEGTEPLEMEIRLKKNDSRDYRYHLLRVLPVKEHDDIIKWAGTFTEIEEQKQAIREKDEFISMASHELKTPLTSILGYTQLLERMTMDEKLQPFIHRTVAQVRKLDSLVSDLLDISKIESGKLKLNMKDFDLSAMLDNTIKMMKETFPSHDIKYAGVNGVIVHGDEARLEQVVVNFLSNAIKYSPAANEVRVETKLLATNKLSVKVIDSGVGIAQDELKHVFDKFYRTEDSGSKFQGLGLGLYICADILVRHNCDYGAESELDKGSVFYFNIPVVQRDQHTL